MDEQRQDDQLEPTYNSHENLTEVMDDRGGRQERVWDICADDMMMIFNMYVYTEFGIK